MPKIADPDLQIFRSQDIWGHSNADNFFGKKEIVLGYLGTPRNDQMACPEGLEQLAASRIFIGFPEEASHIVPPPVPPLASGWSGSLR